MSRPMVQLNTRIPATLKEQGDRALERAGYTPSQAVRALWELAARHAHEPNAVRAALEGKKVDEGDEEAQDRLDAFEKGMQIIDDAYETLGIDPRDTCDFQHLSYKELRNSYYEERLEEGA